LSFGHGPQRQSRADDAGENSTAPSRTLHIYTSTPCPIGSTIFTLLIALDT